MKPCKCVLWCLTAAICLQWGPSRGWNPAVAGEPAGLAAVLRQLVEAEWIDDDGRWSPNRSLRAVPPPDAGSRDAGSTLVQQRLSWPENVTTEQDAAGAVDGVKNGRWGFHVRSGEKDPWWQVDLQEPRRLDRVVVFARSEGGQSGHPHIRVLAAGEPGAEFSEVYRHDGTPWYGIERNAPLVVEFKDRNVTARIVRLQVPGNVSFALDEVEVYTADDPEENIALGRPADQISTSPHSYPGTIPFELGVARYPNLFRGGPSGDGPSPAAGPFALAHTEQVLKRAGELIARLEASAGAGCLAPRKAELEKLTARLAKRIEAGEVPENDRKDLYLDARGLLRRFALANPLVAEIDRLLFIKRHDPQGVIHMCDQYYGCNAVPGGGLYVLENPFGDNPKLVNLLQNSVVESGRLKGRKLEGGSFLSPSVSYDGQTVYFAYSECGAWEKFQGRENYTWNPQTSYHVFRCNADGSNLVQLTDGDYDDFDPYEMPGGRIVFTSLRRGGYLRCGRHCPTYTLHSMEPDGSDIICLSFHETHEWHPSVDHNGMLVYSRWDYVDRDTNVAHHIWISYPDGRDPRSYHGNYPVNRNRNARPWMQKSIRKIPGSHKFVAVAGAHHGHAFGSLILIDHRLEDDGAMGQLTRLTPDMPFPEAEVPYQQAKAFGTPWALSEMDYLCVYDAKMTNRGIFWLDANGNRELIYRDREINALSPIPFRPRPRPPVIPDRTVQTARAIEAAGGEIPPSTIAVMNVYDSDFEWPEGTSIEALRVIQVLPKTTPAPNQPRVGVARQTNARRVLGTVPVESDGSAYFEAPPNMQIYFQALDARGMAVQSMRSGTYLHPGEHLSCQGCHEPKNRQAASPPSPPLALRRSPSQLKPGPEGSSPFNYVRLVQPVLDRHCVDCHRKEKALDLSGAPQGTFTVSYNNLAGNYGFFFDSVNGSIKTCPHGGARTVAGEFGALGAPLLKYLDKSHYGVELSADDFARIVIWLDCNSEFLGAYEEPEAQQRGEPVEPTLD
ncbi:MAG: discoidin domain-containing protein [Thermoguttaceae bacterium]|jgi:hypothetical protein|nr:discoidin domain-containing protein [Thermoguttaceae bacterium]